MHENSWETQQSFLNTKEKKKVYFLRKCIIGTNENMIASQADWNSKNDHWKILRRI